MSAEIAGIPKEGEIYRCHRCGMEITVIVDCACECEDEPPEFACCGESLKREP